MLEAGRSAILLVPEIGLTPAVAADFHQVFAEEVAILHSALPIRNAPSSGADQRGEARVVVGTRSAVFAPVTDLALIIVDEEQDPSYKQEETPRYHARDVAVMRAKMAERRWFWAPPRPRSSRTTTRRTTSTRCWNCPIASRAADARKSRSSTCAGVSGNRTGAGDLAQAGRRNQANGSKREQVMVLLNRRGYSPVVLCRTCGKKLECKNCAIAMTHHKRDRRMECHYCGHSAPVPKHCAHCGSEYV